MMFALMLAAALFTADPPAADDRAADLEGLQQIYDTSCANREYGAYDDMCDELRQRMRSARVEADRERRRPHAKPAIPSAKTPPPAPAPASASPPAPKAAVPNAKSAPAAPPATVSASN